MNIPVPKKDHEVPPVLESACTFGVSSTLTGVYTPPQRDDPSKPCALFLTAGLLHHVGPTRLHVELARALSTLNVAGLRFDLSGVGDSEASSTGGGFIDRSVGEVTQAMDFLERRYGHRHFVLIGLCSGADDSLMTARRDKRVSGVVLINGYAYKAGNFLLHRLVKFYLPRLFMWQKIRNRVEKLVNRTSRKSTQDAQAKDAGRSELDDDFRNIPHQQETADLLLELSNAGTDLLFVYTGSEHDVYTYRGQLYAMFPQLKGSPHVTERYLKEADHTMILKSDRSKVITWVSDWFEGAAFDRQ